LFCHLCLFSWWELSADYPCFKYWHFSCFLCPSGCECQLITEVSCLDISFALCFFQGVSAFCYSHVYALTFGFLSLLFRVWVLNAAYLNFVISLFALLSVVQGVSAIFCSHMFQALILCFGFYVLQLVSTASCLLFLHNGIHFAFWIIQFVSANIWSLMLCGDICFILYAF